MVPSKSATLQWMAIAQNGLGRLFLKIGKKIGRGWVDLREVGGRRRGLIQGECFGSLYEFLKALIQILTYIVCWLLISHCHGIFS